MPNDEHALGKECSDYAQEPLDPTTETSTTNANVVATNETTSYTHFTPAMLLDDATLAKFNHVSDDVLLSKRHSFSAYLEHSEFTERDRDALRALRRRRKNASYARKSRQTRRDTLPTSTGPKPDRKRRPTSMKSNFQATGPHAPADVMANKPTIEQENMIFRMFLIQAGYDPSQVLAAATSEVHGAPSASTSAHDITADPSNGPVLNGNTSRADTAAPATTSATCSTSSGMLQLSTATPRETSQADLGLTGLASFNPIGSSPHTQPWSQSGASSQQLNGILNTSMGQHQSTTLLQLQGLQAGSYYHGLHNPFMQASMGPYPTMTYMQPSWPGTYNGQPPLFPSVYPTSIQAPPFLTQPHL
eukprot:m.122918 g.122918  ORF g.122918 m.122918 type:complete len:361 (+) comp15665_c0_seq1:1064-2146(+)